MGRTITDEVDFSKITTQEDIGELLAPVRGVVAILSAMQIDTGGCAFDGDALGVLMSVLYDVLEEGERLGEKVDYMHAKLIVLRDNHLTGG